MKYLVQATHGPGFASPEEAAHLLKNLVLPSFDILLGWEKENRAVGGLPVGGRAFTLIIEADSNESLDAMLQELPLWGMLQWEVTPLAGMAERAADARAFIKSTGVQAPPPDAKSEAPGPPQ